MRSGRRFSGGSGMITRASRFGSAAVATESNSAVSSCRCRLHATTHTRGSRVRAHRWTAPFQKDSHGVHETLFERIGSVFPPSTNPVTGNECEHPFHHFREIQRLLIGANLPALLAFGEESFVLLVELKRSVAQNALHIGHHPRLLCDERMKLGI